MDFAAKERPGGLHHGGVFNGDFGKTGAVQPTAHFSRSGIIRRECQILIAIELVDQSGNVIASSSHIEFGTIRIGAPFPMNTIN